MSLKSNKISYKLRQDINLLKESFGHFLKLIDFYDQDSQEYQMTFFLFSNLFKHRETLALEQNINPGRVLDDSELMIINHLARKVATLETKTTKLDTSFATELF